MANILVVEDEDQLRELMVEHLEDEGHEIAHASNGQEALDVYPSFKPDLVISDINMPIMGGYDFLKALQTKHPEVEDVPFFFLSALSESEHQIKGLNAGIDEYLCKPVDFTILNARINLSMKRQEKVNEKIRNALEKSTSKLGKADTRLRPTDSSSLVRQPAAAPTGLLASKRPKLNLIQKETIIAMNIVDNFHSAEIINKIGRKVNISRLFLKKDRYDVLYSIMTSSEFDSIFFQEADKKFTETADKFIRNKNFFKERAIIIPIFFEYMQNSDIRNQHIKLIESIEEKHSIAIICETINVPDQLASSLDIFKEMSLHKHVQIIEIKNFNQIKKFDLKSLRIGAITMNYSDAINIRKDDLSKIKNMLYELDINFYIKEIPEGKITNAQSLQADLLSVSA